MQVTPETLKRCLADNDDQAWVDLWAFFEHWVASQLRRTLKRHGFSELDGDDVMQDIWRRLLKDDRRRLACFKGSTRAELKSWLIRVSVNFTRNWVQKKRLAQRREREALSAGAVSTRDGPSEQQVESLLRDLEPLADKGDVRRLRTPDLSGKYLSPVSCWRYDEGVREREVRAGTHQLRRR